MEIELTEDAGQELLEAAEWYEARREGLGEVFMAEVNAVFVTISESPNTWPLWPGWRRDALIRRCPLPRFPYVIAYMEQVDRVLVLAVAHTSREPFYWGKRLTR